MTSQDTIKRHEAWLDPRSFLRYIFLKGNVIEGNPEPTPLQYDIAETIWDTISPIVFNTAKADKDDKPYDRRLIVKAFRGIGKSTEAAIMGVLALYWRPALNIFVCSAAESKALEFTGFMRRCIKEIGPLQWLAPQGAQRDGVKQFDVYGSVNSQAASVRAAGFDGMITGARADIIFADDLETAENARTETMRQLKIDKIAEFASIRKPVSVTVLPGTSHTEDSLYVFLEKKRDYRCVTWPARYPNAAWMADERNSKNLAPTLAERMRKNPALVGQPTDPERFNEFVLKDKESEMGRSAFEMQMMLNAALADKSRYPLHLADLIVHDFADDVGPVSLRWSNARQDAALEIEAEGIGNDQLYRAADVSTATLPFENAIMSIDPAGDGEDAMGVCVTKMLGGIIYCPQIIGLHGGFKENLITICEIAKAHRVKKIIPEKNYGNGMFTSLLMSVMKDNYPDCAIEEFNSVGVKEFRIIDTLEPVMNAHRLVFSSKTLKDDLKFRQGIQRDDQKHYRFLHQLTRLAKIKGCLVHDDLVDALAMSVAYWAAHMVTTTAQAQKSLRERNLEDEIQGWYRARGEPVPGMSKIGHGKTTHSYIGRRQTLIR